jgi:hypothetical protein
MIERTQLLVDAGTVFDVVPVDVLPTLTHRSYNSLILIAPDRWS